MPIYLIHFDRPLAHATHYLGFVKKWDGLHERHDRHRSGAGAKILRRLRDLGIGWKVVMLMNGNRTEERRIKNWGHSKRLCPICNGTSQKQDSMTFIETRIGILRFLKTRPEGTGAKFSEIVRIVDSSTHSVYDALEDLEKTGTIVQDKTTVPRTWRIASAHELPDGGLNRLLSDLGV